MSSDRKDGVTRFNCDGMGCHKNYESSEDQFNKAWAEVREDGWVSVQGSDRWMHLCPSCKKAVGD